LALGSLFRRRGEVDRAIRIHQNLIARPQLNRTQRAEALLALGQDYLCAGVLDRAEHLLLEVVDLQASQSEESLKLLLEIYQREKAWDNAINIAEQLKHANPDIRVHVAHFLCEKAQLAWDSAERDKSLRLLNQALQKDANAVRASVLLGDYNLQLANYKLALYHYNQVWQQDKEYISTVIDNLVACYEHLGKEQELQAYLTEMLKQHSNATVLLALAKRLSLRDGVDAAMAFLAKELKRHPTLKGLQYLVELQSSNALVIEKDNLSMLQDLIDSLLETKPTFRCNRCGFSGRVLHWSCPGCHAYNSVKPICGPEGE
jgi:lipopolysaccharide biosynthesis regulator YciM